MNEKDWEAVKRESEIDADGNWVDKKITYEKKTVFTVDSVSKLVSTLLAPLALLVSVYSIYLSNKNQENSIENQKTTNKNQQDAMVLQQKLSDSSASFNYKLTREQKKFDFFSAVNRKTIEENTSLINETTSEIFAFLSLPFNSPNIQKSTDRLYKELYAKILAVNNQEITVEYEKLLQDLSFYPSLVEFCGHCDTILSQRILLWNFTKDFSNPLNHNPLLNKVNTENFIRSHKTLDMITQKSRELSSFNFKLHFSMKLLYNETRKLIEDFSYYDFNFGMQLSELSDNVQLFRDSGLEHGKYLAIRICDQLRKEDPFAKLTVHHSKTIEYKNRYFNRIINTTLRLKFLFDKVNDELINSPINPH